jgi:hypothetical protein
LGLSYVKLAAGLYFDLCRPENLALILLCGRFLARLVYLILFFLLLYLSPRFFYLINFYAFFQTPQNRQPGRAFAPRLAAEPGAMLRSLQPLYAQFFQFLFSSRRLRLLFFFTLTFCAGFFFLSHHKAYSSYIL